MTKGDLITREVIRNALVAAAVEMNRTLVRTAYNPLLYEVQDFGLGIVGADGRLWAEAPGIAGFISALPDTVRSGISKYGLDGFSEGDVLIVNDPYLTGTHISDTTTYMPVFHRGALVAFAIVTAHWADIGGKTPSGWCPDSTDVYQEGICFSNQKLFDGGRANRDLLDLIAANVRFPDLVLGDLDAQMAACRQGIARVQKLCDKYGVSALNTSMDQVIQQTESMIRRQIAALPDGTYVARVDLDSDGVDPDAQPRVALQVTVKDDRLHVAFEGSSPTAKGPINDPGARTDTRCALKGLFAPTDPGNEGHFLPFDFELPPGLVVSPERPAPVDSYGYVGVAVMELVIRALSEVMPHRSPASGYQLFGLDFFRLDAKEGTPFVFVEPVDGGAGARPDHDGPVLIFVGDGDTRNTPVEVLETLFPIRCERHALLPELAGHGKYRGGCGVARDYRILEEGVMMQTSIENGRDPLAKGLAGGEDGGPSVVVLNPGTNRERVMRDRVSFWGPFDPGEVVSARAGGGGGYGPPRNRDPERVAADVREERITPEQALAIYGARIDSAR